MKRNGMPPFLAPALGLAVVSMLMAGCGGVDRQANVDTGDYYTAEEFKKLSKEQRDAYCAQLEATQRQLDSEADAARARAEEAGGKITGLKSQMGNIDSQLSALESEVRDLEARLAEEKTKPSRYEVVGGDSLWRISGMPKIYGDPVRWPRIYRANRDRIKDPDLIYPGWVLKIPRGYPKEHAVAQGEYLSLIASYWEVYGSAKRWTDIYKANQDQIADPDMIYPNQVLKIPR